MKKIFCILLLTALVVPAYAEDFQTITFASKDDLTITADLYLSHPKTYPFIVLFHQAGFSRGEYRSIAPILNSLGFNTLAVDQRSGNQANSVINETAQQAKDKNKTSSYLDALPDMESAVVHAKKNYAYGKLIIWGSSYSASLVLKIAGDNQSLVDGVLAFSPGEYFKRKMGSTFITDSAKNIDFPVFITSAKDEKDEWWSIYSAIPANNKVFFLPETKGIHGSRALWTTTNEHKIYWEAVKKFLEQFQQ